MNYLLWLTVHPGSISLRLSDLPSYLSIKLFRYGLTRGGKMSNSGGLGIEPKPFSVKLGK